MRHLKYLKTKKGRDESGMFIIEGEKFVQEIPDAWRVVQYVIANRYAAANNIAPYEARARCDVVRDSIFDSLADTISPQGIIAVCEKKAWTLDDLCANEVVRENVKTRFFEATFILLGENLNDPGNIGALIRTAAAAGAHGVILAHGGDIYNPKVLRAAAGAVLRLPCITDISLEEAAEWLSQKNIPIHAAHPRGEKSPYQLDLCANFCLLVGNESHGISDAAASLASSLVTLPMANDTESLNASVAGSILMYEAVRQRRGGAQ